MSSLRPTWVEVDLDAIAHNVRTFAALGSQVMAVVKADGYGHGDVAVARAALDAGATWLGVALVEEGLGLRAAGIEAPILVLSECPPGSEIAAVAGSLTPTVCSDGGLERMAAVARTTSSPIGVHVKVDTGMHRIGVWPPDEAPAFVDRVAESGLALEGLWTHLASADTDEVTTTRQLALFTRRGRPGAAGRARPRGSCTPRTPRERSAYEGARLDLMRIGIGIYGIGPVDGVGEPSGLRPALTWRSSVSFVKRLQAGRRVSYGQRYELARDAWVATVPVGYADGYPRMLSSRADVVIGGRRCRVAGSVTMDQLIVDCGDLEPAPGDDVVLLGAQGSETVTAWELAALSDTIAYEIVARIGARVPRRYTNGGSPA